MTNNIAPTWKRIIVRSAAFGISFALFLVLIVGGYLWYQTRPKPPKPWNKEAITAIYDMVDTEGDDNTIVFYYTLENNSEFDYTVESNQGLVILARLREQGSLSGTKRDDKWLHLDYPIFVPSKQRARFPVHLKYPYPQKEKVNASREERKQFRKALENYINEEMSNLAGFVLFDEDKRFEINLPNGWSSSSDESLLPVKFQDKIGYIDRSGKVTIKPQYDDAEPFSEGLAAVRIGNKCGYINNDGAVTIALQYDFVSSFSEGLALVNVGGEHLFGAPASKPSNTKRKSLFSGGKFGYIDHSGKLVIPLQFEDADDFSDDRARVKVNSKWGFINKQGQFIVKPDYDLVFSYLNGIATVEKGEKVGYVDKSGKLVWDPMK